MLTAVIAGERDPRVLAEMARSRMRSKVKKPEEALDCEFFTEDHAFILQMMLASIDALTARIAVPEEKIAVMCEPCERQVARLGAVPGLGVTASQELIAEIGVDMTVFPSAGHLCSWLQTAPGVKESAGKRKGKNATGRGNPCAGGALGEAAVSAGRTGTYEELGSGYCEERLADTARRARNHIRSLERLGYHVQADPVDPVTGEVLTPAAV